MTGRIVRIIHSGDALERRSAFTRRSRLMDFLRRWPVVERISAWSSSESFSRSICRMISRTADRPREALARAPGRSEEHTSELQSRGHLVCRLLLEKKKKKK